MKQTCLSVFLSVMFVQAQLIGLIKPQKMEI